MSPPCSHWDLIMSVRRCWDLHRSLQQHQKPSLWLVQTLSLPLLVQVNSPGQWWRSVSITEPSTVTRMSLRCHHWSAAEWFVSSTAWEEGWSGRAGIQQRLGLKWPKVISCQFMSSSLRQWKPTDLLFQWIWLAQLLKSILHSTTEKR